MSVQDAPAGAGGRHPGMSRPGRVNGWATRLARLLRRESGFAQWPAPRALGDRARGRHLVEGRVLLGGFLVEIDPAKIWSAAPPSAGYADALHGFAWLDDLAAEASGRARETARHMVHDWTARFGAGQGPGWRPDLAGRRLTQLILHAEWIGAGHVAAADPRDAAYRRMMARHMRVLSRRWRRVPPGLPRLEALSGLLLGALSLRGQGRLLRAAHRNLAEECTHLIDREGGIPGRAPELLAQVFALLGWCAEALSAAGHVPAAGLQTALEHMAPTLRSLRHGDGSLARFHGGGAGNAARLDAALAGAGAASRGRPVQGMAMGYARLARGRSTVILDAAAPHARSPSAHASTLAFELSSGRRHLIVNCGPGGAFGEKWARAGRATASHSTLSIDGHSSARVMPPGPGDRRAELMVEAPLHVQIERRRTVTGLGLMVRHDGYVPTHGLTHRREIELDHEGRALRGEDLLSVVAEPHTALFEKAAAAGAPDGIPFRIRFHLHPAVGAQLDTAGRLVELMLPSGEPWVFRYEGAAELLLEPSVYFAEGELSPQASKQIVLTSRAVEYASRVSWTLAKAYGSPDVMRDLDWDPAAPGGN